MSQLPQIEAPASPDRFKIFLVGNPNVGKSVVFGHLTGTYVTVSNYPGTTVDLYKGHSELAGRALEVVDTPGIASLEAISEDERVARDILITEKADCVLQVGDSQNLARSLFLSLQLTETGLPMVLALNMQDESEAKGIRIDAQKLSSLLGIPVLPTAAVNGAGIDSLKRAIFSPVQSKAPVRYHPAIEKAVSELSPALENRAASARSLALMILSAGARLDEILATLKLESQKSFFEETIRKTRSFFEEPLNLTIAKERYRIAMNLEKAVMQRKTTRKTATVLSDKIGEWCVHPVFGYACLAIVLYVAYQFVGIFGAGYLVGLLEETVFAQYLAPYSTRFFEAILPAAAWGNTVKDLFVGEYGLITMGLSYSFAIILPIVSTFFIMFSLMEDSGYLPRLAYMINNQFKRIGLNGKAVLPMVLGLGCDTMATLTARIMETRKERVLVTLLLALGVPCSAQLGVVLGMFGALPAWAGFVWVATVVLVFVIVGWIAARLLPGASSDFIMVMPPIRLPKLKNILTKTLARIEWYLKEAVPLFLYATLALFFLDRVGALQVIINWGKPLVVGFLNLPAAASEAFLIGFLRRDFGATRFFDLYREGQMDTIQALVSMIVITLFIPCVANVLIIVKERGMKVAMAMAAFIFPFSFLVGGFVNYLLR